MVISGLYVETIPGQAKGVAASLDQIAGVEVHHIQDDYKIVLTIEADTIEKSYKTAESFNKINGILAICLVYTNFEDEPFYQTVETNHA
ncbi:chaperone NapD [Neobacillus sp. LXY-4]|uniref:chaperone NapD n=1 Tax=Neobacillus sp. LXY-4 TaxID=3379826 RepID=UPI003EDF8FFF